MVMLFMYLTQQLKRKLKVGYDTEEFHQKMHGWILSGNLDLVRRYMDIIWKGKTYIIEDPKTKKTCDSDIFKATLTMCFIQISLFYI